MKNIRCFTVALLFAVLQVTACGGGDGPTDPLPTPVTPTLSVSAPSSVNQNGVLTQVTATAAVSGMSAQAVSWTLNGSPAGSGLSFSADLTPGTYQVCARGGVVSDCASVEVIATMQPVSLRLSAGMVATSHPELPLLHDVEACLRTGPGAEWAACTPFNLSTGTAHLIHEVPWEVDSLEISGLGPEVWGFGKWVKRSEFSGAQPIFPILEREWTVAHGVDAGIRRPFSLEECHTPSALGGAASALSFCRRLRHLDGTYIYLNLSSPGEPLPLAFHSNMAEYKGTFWMALNDLQEELGVELFMPAPDNDRDSWNPCWGFQVQRDSLGVYTGGHTASGHGVACFDRNPLDISGGVFHFMSVSSMEPEGDGYKRHLGLYLAHQVVGHGMGHGHTCSWPSVMLYCPQGADLGGPERNFSTMDIVYMEVTRAIGDFQRRYRTPHGVQNTVHAEWHEAHINPAPYQVGYQ